MQDLKIVKWIAKELELLFCVLIGFTYSIEAQSTIPIIMNLLLTIAYNGLKFKNRSSTQHNESVFQGIFVVRLIVLTIQFGFFSSLSQFALVLICVFELEQQMIYFILGCILIINTVQSQNENYVTEAPFNVLFFSVFFVQSSITLNMIFQNWKNKQKKKNLSDLQEIYVEQTFKQQSEDINIVKQSQNQQPMFQREINSGSQSHANSELNGINIDSNNNMQRSNDDDLIIQNMSWISNQSALVYNVGLNIVYQNLYLGKLMKTIEESEQKLDLEQLFLHSIIEVGSREMNELVSQNGFNESIYSDGSFLMNNVNDYHRYKLKIKYTIKDLSTALLSDFDKWRFYTITLYKLTSKYFEFDNLQIKCLVQTINKQKFIIFLFEQANVKNKNSIDVNQSVINIFSTFIHESVGYVNCILTMVVLTIHEYEIQIKSKSTEQIIQYSHPMRLVTLRYIFFLNSMRDYIFYIQNQLFLRISAFRITDLVEELLIIYEDNLKMREVTMLTSIDLNENNQIVFSDLDRCKQIFACLLSYCLRYTTSAQLKLDVKSYTLSGLMISFKDSTIGKDEIARKQISQLVKQLNLAMKNAKNLYEVDLNNPLELQICVLLSYQLSGSFKRGLEFLYDSNGNGTFTFVVESQTASGKNVTQHHDTGPIKILGQRKYFETSLSLLLAQESSQNQYREDSKYFSLTQISKQFSLKPSDPIDLQSAYFSQISRIKQDSSNSKHIQQSGSGPKQSKENSQSFSGTQKQVFNQDSFVQQTYKNTFSKNNKPSSNCKSDSNHDSLRTHSQLDFGAESSNPSIHPPEFQPKLLSSVIKYRLRLNCCAKVIIIDNDHYSIMVLQIVLEKYNIKCDKAFNGLDAINMMNKKEKNPCRCGNKNYLLYFIELNLPIMSGLDFVRYIKEEMKQGKLDKGFSIALSTFVDLNSKLECFKNGMDYFISKPFDLIDIGATVQYLDF